MELFVLFTFGIAINTLDLRLHGTFPVVKKYYLSTGEGIQ